MSEKIVCTLKYFPTVGESETKKDLENSVKLLWKKYLLIIKTKWKSHLYFEILPDCRAIGAEEGLRDFSEVIVKEISSDY